MNKKKMILTSLASVAILGAGFVTSQPTVVRAEEAPVASQSKAEKDYDAAMKKSEAAKKDYEEAKKALEEAKAAQKKYDEDQKKTEAKAEEEKKSF
ncbi:TPA: pneumococcal surface A domain protein [Streptococcus pneumoniae]